MPRRGHTEVCRCPTSGGQVEVIAKAHFRVSCSDRDPRRPRTSTPVNPQSTPIHPADSEKQRRDDEQRAGPKLLSRQRFSLAQLLYSRQLIPSLHCDDCVIPPLSLSRSRYIRRSICATLFPSTDHSLAPATLRIKRAFYLPSTDSSSLAIRNLSTCRRSQSSRVSLAS